MSSSVDGLKVQPLQCALLLLSIFSANGQFINLPIDIGDIGDKLINLPIINIPIINIPVLNLNVPNGPNTIVSSYVRRSNSRQVTTYNRQRYTTKCGFLNLGRCTRYRQSSSTKTVTNYYSSPLYRCSSHARKDGNLCRVDCSVNNWGGWNSCSESCYEGRQGRYRSVSRAASNGGNACPTRSSTRACNVGRTNCKIEGRCWSNNYVRTTSTVCQQCLFTSSKTRWQAHSGSKCNDANACTKDDTCTNGRCAGTGYSCQYSCTACNGAGGCNPKSGFCLIERTKCYNRGATNPNSPHCQYCLAGTQWSNRPVNTACTNTDLCIRNNKCNSNGQCVGQDYRHECKFDCQQCSSSGTCAQTKGCIKNNQCGCSIAGKCYGERETNPASQCHYCKFQENHQGWTRKEDGFICNDNNVCTHTDRCVSGTCRGTAYQCDKRAEDVCLSSNTCDGNGNCVPSFHGSSKRCYTRKDECDHPDTSCTGSHAVCSITTIKPLSGTPITLGTITLTDRSGTTLPTTNTKSGEMVALTSDTQQITIQLSSFLVPCGPISYTAQLMRHPKSAGEVSGNVNTQGTSGQTVTMNMPVTLQHGLTYKVIVVAKNLRNNQVTQNSLPLLVDTTPPTLTDGINDGPLSSSTPFNVDIDYQASLTQLTVNWNNAKLLDEESGVSRDTLRMSYGTSSAAAQHAYVQCPSDERSKGYCKLQGLSLQGGVRYWAFLSVDNVVGRTAVFISDGITPDNTPPNGGTLALQGMIPLAHANYAFILSTTGITLTGILSGVTDAESGLERVTQTLCDQSSNLCTEKGQTEFSCPNQPCTFSVNHPADRLTAQGSFIHSHIYNLDATIYNRAGLSSIVKSANFLVDLVPPSAGNVFDGKTAGLDSNFQSNTMEINANWNGFVDSESGIKHYVATVRDENDAILATSTTASSSITFQSLSLSHGVTYKVCVEAKDNGNNGRTVCSNGVLIDNIPPSGGKVVDINPTGGSLADIDYQISPTSLKLKVTGFQALSGIQSYSWSIGTTAGTSDVVSKQLPSLTTTQTATGLSLKSGQKYFANVWCTSRAGLTTLVSSDGVTVDTSPPTAGSVFDLCTNTDTCSSLDDIDFSPDNTKVRSRWFGFADEHSGIKQYDWNYADCSSRVLLHKQYQYSQLNTESNGLPNGAMDTNVRYCITVRATNNAGLSTSVWSDGFLVDIDPPETFKVTDGTSFGNDIDHQNIVSMLQAVWQLPVDKQSGVEFQTIVAKRSSPLPLATIGDKVRLSKDTTSYTIGGLQLTDLETYLIEVCAVNYAGLERCSTSDGVFIDVTAPTKGLVFTGVTTAGKRYQSSSTSLSARWHSFIDRHSDIAHFTWAIKSANTGTVVKPKENVGFRMGATATNLALTSGEQYVVVVEAVNNAGGVVESQSEAITIDTTPAINTRKPVLSFNGNTAMVSWESFQDVESEIWYYKWAIGVEPNGDQITGYNMAGNSSNSAQMQGPYVTGQVYYATIVARNRAGLWSYENRGSSPVKYDGTPPVLQNLHMVDTQTGEMVGVASESSKLACKWDTPQDPESDLMVCKLSIAGSSSNDIRHTSTVSPAGTLSYNIPASVLNSGGIVFKCQLECKNTFNLSSTITSNPVTMDQSDPSPGVISVPEFWPHSSSMEISWTPCTDDQTDIVGYEWAVVDSMGNIVSEMKLHGRSSFSGTVGNLQLVNGQRYAVQMVCVNAAGLSVQWLSGLWTVDLTEPNVNPVTASIHALKGATPGTNANMQISAHWPASNDVESGITGYRWAVGVNPGGCQVSEFSSSTNTQNMVCSSCSLKHGETYYVTVETINRAGQTMKSISSPMTVDYQPPKQGQVEIQNVDAVSGVITARCHSFLDQQTSIKTCQWTLLDRMEIASDSLSCVCSDCTFSITPPINNAMKASLMAPRLQVKCTDDNNENVTAETLVDLSSPSAGQLICKPYMDSSSDLSIQWTRFYDFQAPNVQFQWHIADTGSPPANPVWRSDGVSATTSTIRATNLNLVQGQNYTMTLMVVNDQVLSASSSCSFKVDSTPPEQGNVQFAGGKVYVSDIQSLSIDLSGFQDEQSGIMDYEWCLETQSQTSTRIFCRNIGRAVTADCQQCPTVPGLAYIIRVKARNHAGLSSMAISNAVTLDRTPPSIAYVYEGLRGGDDIDYIKSTDILNVQHSGFLDSESGIDFCQFELVKLVGSTVVWSMTDSTTLNSVSLSITDVPNLSSGESMTSRVTCWNNAGLSSFNTSDGIAFDSSPPKFTGIRTNLVYGPTQTDIQIWLDGVEDSESGVEFASVFLVNVGQNVTAYSVNQMDYSSYFTISGANMTQGERYNIHVTVLDRAGWSTKMEANQFVFDRTGPSDGVVNDGDSNDIDYTSVSSSLSANWGSIRDTESGISHFDWAIGTTPGGTQILGYTYVGISTSASCPSSKCKIEAGLKYYVTVRATNKAESQSWFTSDGITVDTTPPFGTTIYIDGGTSTEYVSSNQILDISWGSTTKDYESPIQSYSACLSTAMDTCTLQQAQSVNMATSVNLTVTQRPSDTALYAVVMARNSANLIGTTTSWKLSVDNTPPEAGLVADGEANNDEDCQRLDQPVTASWQGFQDQQSGIEAYYWAIGSKPLWADIQKWTNVGLQTSGTSMLNNTTAGQVVYSSVRAVNKAKLSSEASSDGLRLQSLSTNNVAEFCMAP